MTFWEHENGLESIWASWVSMVSSFADCNFHECRILGSKAKKIKRKSKCGKKKAKVDNLEVLKYDGIIGRGSSACRTPFFCLFQN